MNKEERPTMASVEAISKYLVEIFRVSECPSKSECPDTSECNKCKYKELCEKLYELAKVVDNDSI